MEYNKLDVGNRIFLARKEKDLKQAEVCKILGINQSTYSKIETGKYDITMSMLFKLSNIFDVSVNWIIGTENKLKFTNSELSDIDKYKKYIISLRK